MLSECFLLPISNQKSNLLNMPTDFPIKSAPAIEHLHHELQSIRTGRANPALVEELSVDAYGTPTPLVQLAAISVPEPRLILIQPWDPSIIKEIERSLTQSSLGITPVVDGKNIRLPFPQMTEERRQSLVKVVNEKSEETRVALRSIREDIIRGLRQKEKNGELSEDALELLLKEIQKDVTAALEEIKQIVDEKHTELTTI